MEPTKVLPIISLGSLVTVEYGGWALLSFLTAREGLTDPQKSFFRAGHAHAGVLLILSLVFSCISTGATSATARSTADRG